MVTVVLAGALMLGLLVISRRPESAVRLPDGVSDDPAVSAILSRSCQDCHSDRTRWPWYTNVPPASWLVSADVKEARSHMDFSRWKNYSLEDKQQILTEIAASARNEQMPPARYLMMHPDARLSLDETALLYTWARSERRKVRAQEAGDGRNLH